MKTMKTNTATPTSVAARLTDEEIIKNASRVDELSYDGEIGSCGGFSCGDNSPNTEEVSAVLRDYVRLRRMANAVEDAFVKFAVEYEYRIIENADTRDMGREELANDENWQALKRLLADAEKGEAK